MSSKNYHWYNNGTIQVNAKECPKGFVPGMLRSSIEKANRVKHEHFLSGQNKVTAETTAKRLKTLAETKRKKWEALKVRIPKEELKRYYIDENHTQAECMKKFSVTSFSLDWLIDQYDIHKDKKQAFKHSIQTKLDLYGKDNMNNWKKGHQTRIEKSGSLEASYAKGMEVNKATCLDRYGTECTFNLEHLKDTRKKKYTTPNNQFDLLLNHFNIEHGREKVIGTKSYDFVVDKTLIEINPTATHNTTMSIYGDNHLLSPSYHKDKTKLANDNGYRCIHVWDWDNHYAIIRLLNKSDKVYARQCKLKEVDKTDAVNFINEYHIQRYARDSIRLGLYYKDELVSIMTFGKPRYNKKYEYELIRYCSKMNVVGGAEKLFKHFIATYDAKSIISYCDSSKFTGNTYIKLGFKFIAESGPTKHWHNLKTSQHFTDNLIRKQGFSRIVLNHDASLDHFDTNDNDVLMKRAGFLEVFDCGQKTFIWMK